MKDSSKKSRKWQLDKVSQGLCACCGKRPLENKTYCNLCAENNRSANRLRSGYKKWVPGSKGRPPSTSPGYSLLAASRRLAKRLAFVQKKMDQYRNEETDILVGIGVLLLKKKATKSHARTKKEI